MYFRPEVLAEKTDILLVKWHNFLWSLLEIGEGLARQKRLNGDFDIHLQFGLCIELAFLSHSVCLWQWRKTLKSKSENYKIGYNWQTINCVCLKRRMWCCKVQNLGIIRHQTTFFENNGLSGSTCCSIGAKTFLKS